MQMHTVINILKPALRDKKVKSNYLLIDPDIY